MRNHLFPIIPIMILSACSHDPIMPKTAEVKTPQPYYYVIDVDRGLREHDKSQGRVLYLAPLRITSQYRSKQLVVKIGDNAFQLQQDQQFFETPEEMLTSQLKRWLEKTGIFRQVITEQDGTADYMLEAAVTGLYGDNREQHPTQAILEMQFFLTDLEAKQEEVVFQTGLHIDIDINDVKAASLVAGWQRGLKALLSTLEEDLNNFFNDSESEAKG